MKKLLCCVLIVFVLSTLSFADDRVPPPWRGQPGSTMTQWEFLTPDVVPLPEIENNPFGGSFMQIYPTHPWEQVWGGRVGVWALSGLIEIEIDNNPQLNPFKLVQIQLTWAGQYDSGAAIPTISVGANLVTGAPADVIEKVGEVTIDLEPTGVQGADPLWHHTTYLFEIYPNPAIEFIDVGGSIWVDEIVIDTICVPEPMTLTLLGLGSLLLRRRI